MNKIAILIAGWHYPKKFYEQMADLSVPIGYEFDNFVVTHRDIDLPIVHEEKLEVLKRIDEKTLFGKMDYELYSEKPSKKYFESLGFEIIEAENNYGDYQYVNQWLEIYDYKNYEYVCYIHDDTYITDYELVTDIVEGKCELYYHDNREALANYDNWLMVYNTNADGSGDTNCLHVNSNGNLLVQNAASVNMLPANTANSGITNDPANSFAVGLRGRQTIADASTETFLKCDSDGHLEVDVKNTANVKFEDISSSLNSGTADNPANSLAVGMRGRTNIGSQATETFVKVNTSGQIENPVKEKEQVDIFSVGTSVAAGATETSSSLELKGSGKAHLFIKTGSTDQSATFQLSGDGTNFYNPSSGGTLTPVGTPTADMLVAEVETGAKFIRVLYNNTGGGGANVITSSKLTYA